MFAAARFVGFLCADQDNRVIVVGGFAVDEALGAAGFFTADDTDGMKFGHFLGDAHQTRHRAEWLGAEVHVQPGDNYADVPVGEFFNHAHDTGVEKLNLINGDHRRVGQEAFENLPGSADWLGFDVLSIVAGDVLDAVTGVQIGFKDLDGLPGDDRPARAANQFLSFTAEHTAADDFDTSAVMKHLSPFRK